MTSPILSLVVRALSGDGQPAVSPKWIRLTGPEKYGVTRTDISARTHYKGHRDMWLIWLMWGLGLSFRDFSGDRRDRRCGQSSVAGVALISLIEADGFSLGSYIWAGRSERIRLHAYFQ
jgi:hypothetical protein